MIVFWLRCLSKIILNKINVDDKLPLIYFQSYLTEVWRKQLGQKSIIWIVFPVKIVPRLWSKLFLKHSFESEPKKWHHNKLSRPVTWLPFDNNNTNWMQKHNFMRFTKVILFTPILQDAVICIMDNNLDWRKFRHGTIYSLWRANRNMAGIRNITESSWPVFKICSALLRC